MANVKVEDVNVEREREREAGWSSSSSICAAVPLAVGSSCWNNLKPSPSSSHSTSAQPQPALRSKGHNARQRQMQNNKRVTFTIDVDLTKDIDSDEEEEGGSDRDGKPRARPDHADVTVTANAQEPAMPLQAHSSSFAASVDGSANHHNLDMDVEEVDVDGRSNSVVTGSAHRNGNSRSNSNSNSDSRSDMPFTLDYTPRPVPSASVSQSLVSHTGDSCTSTPGKSSTSTMRTSAITLLDTEHGRQRRMQRAIPQREIQAAIKYGKKSSHPSNPNRVVYEYNGAKHVINERYDDRHDHEEESTSQRRGKKRHLVTTMVKTVQLERKYIDAQQWNNHLRDKEIIFKNSFNTNSSWNSHSVLIVDRSGSMRNSDVSGSRTRLGAVWMSIAKDFIQHRLEAGLADSMDVISIILMGENAEVIIDRAPTNYVLYNRIIELFHDSEEADRMYRSYKRVDDRIMIRPKGHGFYGPSLQKAKQMLTKYDDRTSALQLLILSDGRPSDGHVLKVRDYENTLKKHVEEMASQFGRRFTFAAIGMGNRNEYTCLKNMAGSCRDFGGSATFQVPGMSCNDIGVAITGAATSLAECQTELGVFGTAGPGRGPKRRRVIRSCLRENIRLMPVVTEVVDDEAFHIYMGDKVDRCVYQARDTSDNSKRKHTFVAANLQHPDARGVAMKKKAFGEGQERLAFQFFEVAADGVTVVGEPKVAKESRFIDDSFEGDGDNDETANADNNDVDNKSRDKFAKRFCSIQNQAKSIAEAFNKKLDSISTLDPQTPRVSFINCSVYYLEDDQRGEFAVIVEPKLEGKFEKWNNNNGWLRRSKLDKGGHTVVNLVEDDENEEDDDDDDDDSIIDITPGRALSSNTAVGGKEFISVTNNEVAQSFSHFSYHWTRKKIVICDLQGVFDAKKNQFCLTDPVLHYNNARNQDQSGKSGRYGRTDMGQRGINSFLKSHKCNRLCGLVCGGFLDATDSY